MSSVTLSIVDLSAEDERRQAEQALERMMKEVDRIKSAERRRREMEERLLKRMVESEGRLQEAKAEEVSRFFSGQCPSANSKLCGTRALSGLTQTC